MAIDQNLSSVRRKFPRKSFRKSLSYMCAGLAEVAEGVEIGEGGISFKSQFDLPLDFKIVLNFFLPDGDFYSLKGTVKNKKELNSMVFIYGVSFDDVSISLKRQIRAYVARTSSVAII